MMRNLEIKLQSAVFNLRCETWKTNCNRQYLIDDVKPEKQTATNSIKFMMRNLKFNLQSAGFNFRCESWKQTVTISS